MTPSLIRISSKGGWIWIFYNISGPPWGVQMAGGLILDVQFMSWFSFLSFFFSLALLLCWTSKFFQILNLSFKSPKRLLGDLLRVCNKSESQPWMHAQGVVGPTGWNFSSFYFFPFSCISLFAGPEFLDFLKKIEQLLKKNNFHAEKKLSCDPLDPSGYAWIYSNAPFD